MSRIGRQPIQIPDGVTLEVHNQVVTVKGSKGELTTKIIEGFNVEQKDGVVTVVPQNLTEANRKFYGLSRSLIANMIEGVSKGFEKQLEIQGVGYRAQMEGANLVLALGFSHKITVTPPEGITITVENNTKITVSGYDKQQVGMTAANIRALKKPEPYKGKGIRYIDEHVRRKAGKTAAKGA